MGCFTQKRCSPELALTLRLPLSRSLSFSPSFPYKLVSQVSKPLLRPTKCHLYCLLGLIGCCLVPQPAAAAPQTFLQGLSPWPGFLHRAGGYLISRTSAPPHPHSPIQCKEDTRLLLSRGRIPLTPSVPCIRCLRVGRLYCALSGLPWPLSSCTFE